MTNPLRKSAWEARTGEDRRHCSLAIVEGAKYLAERLEIKAVTLVWKGWFPATL